MRHLMSPLDLSVQETDKLLNLANDIEKKSGKNMHTHVPAKSLLPASMSQVPEHDSVSKQLC